VAALVLLAVLGLPVLLFHRNPARNLLLVSPVEDGSVAFDLQRLSTIAGDEFLLTYEVRRRIQVKTAYAEYPVTVIGTNSLYPSLTAFPMLRGGFFTGAAEREKNREAVLNRAAAFRLFGSENIAGRTLTMEGIPWLVTGVMDDGDKDNPRVYVPAVIAGEGPRSLLVLLNGAGNVDAAHIKNTLMSLGANGASHVFFDLSAAVRLYGDRFTLALRIFICALFCIAARKQTAVLKALVLALIKRLKHAYTGELFRRDLRKHAGKLARFTFAALALSGGSAVCFILLLQCLTICLRWADMPSLTLILGKGDFPAIGAPLLDWYYPDTLVFALCLITSGLIPLSRFRGLKKTVPSKPPAKNHANR
jgi:hypothetical protein